MDLSSVQATFLNESRELLEDMETALIEMERNSDDPELINAIFRAAHTIKGTGGVFGFEQVQKFTHTVESVLDKVRSNLLKIDSELIALLLKCRDHIGVLIELDIADKKDTEIEALDSVLTQNLLSYLDKCDNSNKQSNKQIVEKEDIVIRENDSVSTDNWHISIRFSEDVFAHGLDPLSIIRYLTQIGEIVHVTTIANQMPVYNEYNPEKCYLGFEIDFSTQVTKDVIEQVFEFVRDDCILRILPPRTSISKYVEFIDSIEEENLRIGEILLKGGALSRTELEEALRIQKLVNKTNSADSKRATVAIGDVLVNEHMVHSEVVEAAAQKQQTLRSSVGGGSLRVDAEKLDHLINLIGELVIAGAGTSLHAISTGDAALIESISIVTNLVEDVRDSALRLRMVQIGDTFNRFQRVVRDVSKELDKDIDLVITGAETELDKTVVEKIGDPLMHLVRNSIDHGIEPAEMRVAKGKPSVGTLRLNAYHDSGSIVIEVSDDGAGLNRDKILDKAIQKGIVLPDQQLEDQDVYNLIFEPGFSTTESVTNLSGRGVGMDVVKRNIVGLRGTVEIENRANNGTTIRVRLPLTLAIIDGFQVGVENSSYVVPLDMVLECVELSQIQDNNCIERDYINLRGEVLPFIRLRNLFNISGRAPRRENVVVVHYAGNKAGLVVDSLMGEFQTVIKPLGQIFSHVKGVSGSTILGNGEVALILDVPGLVQTVSSVENRTMGAAA